MTDRWVFPLLLLIAAAVWLIAGMPVLLIPVPVPGELCRDIPAVADIDLSPLPVEVDCGGSEGEGED